MKFTARVQRYLLAMIIAGVILAFRGPTVLRHRAWSGGRSTVLGHIDEVRATQKMRVVRYSYEVAGKPYSGEITGGAVFSEHEPATVTYAISDPSVSTILPDEIAGIYTTSFVFVILSVIPLLVVIGLDVKGRSALLSK